jgi:hypothetical protein
LDYLLAGNDAQDADAESWTREGMSLDEVIRDTKETTQSANFI